MSGRMHTTPRFRSAARANVRCWSVPRYPYAAIEASSWSASSSAITPNPAFGGAATRAVGLSRLYSVWMASNRSLAKRASSAASVHRHAVNPVKRIRPSVRSSSKASAIRIASSTVMAVLYGRPRADVTMLWTMRTSA